MNDYHHLKCYTEGQPIFAIYVNVVMVTTVYLEIRGQPMQVHGDRDLSVALVPIVKK